MADTINPITAPLSGTTGAFDTAAMQIALARAQAAAANSNEIDFLKAVATRNDESNAQALVGNNVPPADGFVSNGLIDPDPVDPATLPAFNEFGTDALSKDTTSDSFKAQQLHDLAILQKDAAQLADAANATPHAPLNNNATTVDFSPAAQSIAGIAPPVNPLVPSAPQLTQVAQILQPLADKLLTSDVLQLIQTQLAATQNPIRLSMNNIALALNAYAVMQQNPDHMLENPVPSTNGKVVAPVAPVAPIAAHDTGLPA